MSSTHSILIVDDDPYVRDVLEQFLSLRGYIVSTAADGFGAMDLLERQLHDVLLLDIKMPRLSGLEVLRRILAAGMNVGVIMISGYDDEEELQRDTEQEFEPTQVWIEEDEPAFDEENRSAIRQDPGAKTQDRGLDQRRQGHGFERDRWPRSRPRDGPDGQTG